MIAKVRRLWISLTRSVIGKTFKEDLFFFEKKNQKTFETRDRAVSRANKNPGLTAGVLDSF